MSQTRPLPLAFLMLQACLATLSADSDSFEAEGRYVRQAWRNDGTELRREESYTFRVQYRHPRWSILTKNHSHELRDAEFSFDGTNQVFCAFKANSEFTTPITTNTFFGHAEIRREAMPHCRLRPVNSVVWLALCSRSYFETRSNRAEPLFVTDSLGADMDDLYSTPVEHPCVIRWNKNFRHAPSTIEFYNDGHVYGWEYAGQSLKKPPERRQLPEPFDKGYLQARLMTVAANRSVSDTTPWQTAVYEQFGRSTHSHTPQKPTFLLERHTLTITNFMTTCSRDDFLPKLNGQVMVSECRFETAPQPVHKFQYATRSWLNDIEVKQLKEYTNQLALQPSVIADIENRRPRTLPSRNQSHAPIVIGLLSVCFTAFTIHILLKRTKYHNQ